MPSGARTRGRAGGCGPGTGCTSRSGRWTGPPTRTSLLCSARPVGPGPLIVLLMARAGLRRGEVLGLRRSDVHLLADSRGLGCETARAHLHVVRRSTTRNRAIAKSRRQRAVPLDFITVQAFDTYEFERMRVPRAAGGDFVMVNLFREPVGAPMRLDAVRTTW